MMNATQLKPWLAETQNIAVDDIGADLPIRELIVESFALIETVIRLQEDFGVRLTQQDLNDVVTVGDLERLVATFQSSSRRHPNDQAAE